MPISDLRKRPIALLIACLAMLCASPAAAQDSDFARAYEVAAEADASMGQAVADAKAGRNRAACTGFKRARSLYISADFAVPTTSTYAATIRAANQLSKAFQRQADSAGELAKAYCELSDEAPQTRSTSSNSNSNSSSSTAQSGFDLDSRKQDLQRTADLAHSQYKEADRMWDAGDRAGACAAIRLSTANFDKISGALKANPALRGAFGNPDVVLENGKIAAELRDKTFCSKVTGMQRDSLRRDMSLADNKGDEAKRLYEADDLAGSCTAARLSTDAYDRLTSAMRTDPTLRAAFEDPESVFENAKVMADHRDRFYCAKPG